jgi:hypothetical protein
VNVADIHPVRVPSAVSHGSLEDGMIVCLGLLKNDPERFERVALTWYARWCASNIGASFAECRAVLASLEALGGPNPAAAARELSAVCRECGSDGLVSVLDAWLARAA